MKAPQNILELCRAHRQRTYFVSDDGLIGVYNHRDDILWYEKTLGGFSLVGSTKTPRNAELRYAE